MSLSNMFGFCLIFLGFVKYFIPLYSLFGALCSLLGLCLAGPGPDGPDGIRLGRSKQEAITSSDMQNERVDSRSFGAKRTAKF